MAAKRAVKGSADLSKEFVKSLITNYEGRSLQFIKAARNTEELQLDDNNKIKYHHGFAIMP